MARLHRAPSDAGRNVIRVQVTLLPSDLADLDALAARLSEPGLARNRSAAVRHVLRAYLNREAEREGESRRRKP